MLKIHYHELDLSKVDFWVLLAFTQIILIRLWCDKIMQYSRRLSYGMWTISMVVNNFTFATTKFPQDRMRVTKSLTCLAKWNGPHKWQNEGDEKSDVPGKNEMDHINDRMVLRKYETVYRFGRTSLSNVSWISVMKSKDNDRLVRLFLAIFRTLPGKWLHLGDFGVVVRTKFICKI